MDAAVISSGDSTDRGQALERERGRQLRFIRRHIADASEAEDILQDVFCEFVSFKELAARTGCGVNTLLARKRYAVLHLRRRLRPFYDEITGGEESR